MILLVKDKNRRMNARETLIHQITKELAHLPEEDLSILYGIAQRLRAQLTRDKPSEQADQPEALPFVDEIDRVREQSRQVPGQNEDQQFT